MERLDRVGVLLNGTSADATALEYGVALTRMGEAQRVLCVLARDAFHTEAGEKTAPDALERMVWNVFPAELRERTEVRFVGGSVTAEFLRVARDEDLDLVVKGRELPSRQVDVAAIFARVARKSPCSTLIVPEQVRPHLSRLLVPVDFSDHSRLALETALGLARASQRIGERPQITVQTVFNVGYGYAMTGASFSEAAARIESATSERLERFLEGVDASGVQFDRICTCSEHTAHAVHDLAAVRKMDLIVVGSRGLSPAAAAILGSNAERILVGAALPVLIIKQKGETTGLLNALLDQG